MEDTLHISLIVTPNASRRGTIANNKTTLQQLKQVQHKHQGEKKRKQKHEKQVAIPQGVIVVEK